MFWSQERKEIWFKDCTYVHQKETGNPHYSKPKDCFPQILWTPLLTRVELISKKFIIFFHEQTLVTIYRYKSKIVKIFGFQHLLVHAVLTIFGVKEPIANIDPKFSNFSCRSLHILIIYPYKYICLRLENTSIVKRFVYHGLFGG